jgi:hypothetical protein
MNANWFVQFESQDSRSADGSEPDNLRTIINPGKVLCPNLGAWVEKWNLRLRDWIFGVSLTAFVVVAEQTSKPKILFGRRAIRSLGNEVFNMHGIANYVLKSLAVSAAVASSFCDTLANGFRNIGLAHGTSLSTAGSDML